MTRVLITVRRHDDREDDITGAYLLYVNPELEEAEQASAALDVLHDTVPIKVLDHYECSTWKGVAEASDHTGYSLLGEATFECKLL